MSVRRSLAWTYSAQGLNFFIAFSSSLVIARLVSPRDFGIFAMAGSVSAILNLFCQFGLASYVVREAEVDRNLLRSAFTVNMCLTLILSALTFAAGVAAQNIFHSVEVGEFLTVFAAVPLITMLEFIPAALCSRLMRFGTLAAISVLRTTVTAGVTILLAALGYAHMSFAWAAIATALAAALVSNVLLWPETVFRPRFRGFRAILIFGIQMVSVNGFSQFGTRVGEMILGSWLGLHALGLYTRASNLTSQLYANIFGLPASVLFTKLSVDLRETGQFHDSFLRAVRILLALAWPAMLGMAILANPIIFRLYGIEWLDSAVPLALLLCANFVVLGVGMNWQVFVLREETGRQVRIEAIRSVAGLALFCGGCLISLPAAAAAKLCESIITYLLYRPHMDRLIGIDRGELDQIYGETLLLTGAAVIPSLALMIGWNWSATTPLPAVGASIALGVSGWFSLLVIRRHPLLDEFRRVRAWLPGLGRS